MLILLGGAVLLGGGVALLRLGGFASGAEFVGMVTSIVGGLILLIGGLGVPLNHMDTLAKIAEIRAIEATAADARASGNEIEGAAFRLRVSEANEWIASAQYWNGTVFDIWWPDDVEALTPIR